jgi:histidine triad (HIT) family protein
MQTCIFCEIRDNQKESIITEDENAFVILDKYPSSDGHMLIISKNHSTSMLDAEDIVISKMFLLAKRMALRAKQRLGADGVNVSTNIGKEAGQIIDHFHIHVTPRYATPKKGFLVHKELSAEHAKDLIKRLS